MRTLFESLKKRVGKRLGEKSKAIQACPRKLGDIFIGVYRRDDLEPLAGIPTSVDGPTPGAPAHR